MKVTKSTKTFWAAGETSRGIVVRLVLRKEKYQLGADLFFDTIEDVKAHCKGEIVFTRRKVVTTKSTVVSD